MSDFLDGLAVSGWLADKSANTRRAYLHALADLLRFTGKAPTRIASADVQAWVADLRGRGLAPSTVCLRLSAVSSFFQYASGPGHQRDPTETVDRPRVVRRPSTRLSEQDRARLLAVIPRTTVRGLRDYALILGCMLRGAAGWRCVRWGDFRARRDRVWYVTHGGRVEIPDELWRGVLSFLEASDRLGGMDSDDYVFTPLTDNAVRLPNVEAGAWHRNRPLARKTVNHLLRKYARRAGLDATGMTLRVIE